MQTHFFYEQHKHSEPINDQAMLMQVLGSTSPEWASLVWQQRPDLDAADLHGLQSGRIHIHIYLCAADSADDKVLEEARPEHDAVAARRASGQDCSTSNGHSSADDAREGWRRREQLQQQQQQPSMHASTVADPAASAGSTRAAEQPAGGTGALPAPPPRRANGAGQVSGACERVGLPGRLALAAWVDLNALEPLGALTDLDSRVLPPATLILELADGLYVWPPCAHMLRTASGAVPPVTAEGPPAAAPAPAPGKETHVVGAPGMHGSGSMHCRGAVLMEASEHCMGHNASMQRPFMAGATAGLCWALCMKGHVLLQAPRRRTGPFPGSTLEPRPQEQSISDRKHRRSALMPLPVRWTWSSVRCLSCNSHMPQRCVTGAPQVGVGKQHLSARVRAGEGLTRQLGCLCSPYSRWIAVSSKWWLPV